MSRPTLLSVAALLALALSFAGCADQENDTTLARATVIDRRIDALATDAIDYVNGTYHNCTSRSGAFSLVVAGNPSVDHDELSVLKGDIGCILAISAIHTTRDGLLQANAPISLGTSYGAPRSFGTPAKYYANALLNSASFEDDLSLTLLFSDDPGTATDSPTVSGSAARATVAVTSVASPNYALDLASVAVTTDIKRIADEVHGHLELTPGSQTGDFYVLVAGEVDDTYAAMQSAYDAGAKQTMATSIPASALLAPGVDLTGNAIRTVIIARSSQGVTSYQKFAVTFRPPT